MAEENRLLRSDLSAARVERDKLSRDAVAFAKQVTELRADVARLREALVHAKLHFVDGHAHGDNPAPGSCLSAQIINDALSSTTASVPTKPSDTERLEWILQTGARVLNPPGKWEVYLPSRGLPSAEGETARKAIDSAVGQTASVQVVSSGFHMVGNPDMLSVTMQTCIHHNDSEREQAGCPVCMMAEAEALAKAIEDWSKCNITADRLEDLAAAFRSKHPAPEANKP